MTSISGIIPSDGEAHLIKDDVSFALAGQKSYLMFPIQELRRHLVDILPVGSNLVVRAKV